jgi:hypothetical protein
MIVVVKKPSPEILERFVKLEEQQNLFDEQTLRDARKGKIFILKAKIIKKKQGKFRVVSGVLHLIHSRSE